MRSGPADYLVKDQSDSQQLERSIRHSILRKCAERDLHQQLTRISLLNQITHAISEHMDLEGILSVVLGQLEIHLPLDYCSVYLFNPHAGTSSQAASRFKDQSPAAHLIAAYDQLRQTQQAVMQHERLRALGQMASGIAHDINNALSPVSGFAELLLRRQDLSETTRKYLHHIKTASDDVAHIVTRMGAFYRNREERQPLLPVKLNQLSQQVIELTRPRWRDISQQRGFCV